MSYKYLVLFCTTTFYVDAGDRWAVGERNKHKKRCSINKSITPLVVSSKQENLTGAILPEDLQAEEFVGSPAADETSKSHLDHDDDKKDDEGSFSPKDSPEPTQDEIDRVTDALKKRMEAVLALESFQIEAPETYRLMLASNRYRQSAPQVQSEMQILLISKLILAASNVSIQGARPIFKQVFRQQIKENAQAWLKAHTAKLNEPKMDVKKPKSSKKTCVIL